MRRSHRVLGVAALVACTPVVIVGCGSGSEDGPAVATPGTVLDDAQCLTAEADEVPVVASIAVALAATDASYGSPQRYFEVSADRQRVSLIVATGGGDAEQVFFCGRNRRTVPISLGPAEGATFTASDVDVDPDRVFTGIIAELDDPDIVDFAVQGAAGGVAYDATVRSNGGGVLLVLVSGDGEVLAVRAV